LGYTGHRILRQREERGLLSNAYKFWGGTSWKTAKLKTEKGITTVRKEVLEGGRELDSNSCPKLALILAVVNFEILVPETYLIN
jgi:hypothetical protein